MWHYDYITMTSLKLNRQEPRRSRGLFKERTQLIKMMIVEGTLHIASYKCVINKIL